MKPIKLQLLLENCEILEFDWNDVEGVSFENTYDAVDIDKNGDVKTIKCCQKFYIFVKGKGGKYSFSNGSRHWTERLKEGDITHVYVVFDDNSEVSYRVEWPKNRNMDYHPHQGVDTTWMSGTYLIYCCKETKEFYGNVRKMKNDTKCNTPPKYVCGGAVSIKQLGAEHYTL